ncbi:MAG: RDD family protein [Candidatus Bathyarchaeota archaeon]|nr:RDD family protein [Candidatus Bathyarchaeum tardum]
MVENDENVSKILHVLSHKLRRDILIIIDKKKEQSFSELMNTLQIDTGKTSFHLRKLRQFVDQTPEGNYKLNKLGIRALMLLKEAQTVSMEFDVLKNQKNQNIAKFYKRVLAFLFDIGVAFTMTIAISLVAEVLVLFSGQFLYHQNIFLLLGFLWLYSSLVEGYAGQTVGKSMFMIKTVSLTKIKMSYDDAAVRNFGKIFLLPFDLLLGYKLHDERFIKFFDKYSRTTVIQLKSKN